MKHLLRDREERGGIFVRLWNRVIAPVIGHQLVPQGNLGNLSESDFTLDSNITLKRIQGSLKDNWASAIDSAIDRKYGKTREWANSTAKRLMTIKESLPAVSKNPVSNAPGVEDEIRGLDDIFPDENPGLQLQTELAHIVEPAAPAQAPVNDACQMKLEIEVAGSVEPSADQHPPTASIEPATPKAGVETEPPEHIEPVVTSGMDAMIARMAEVAAEMLAGAMEKAPVSADKTADTTQSLDHDSAEVIQEPPTIEQTKAERQFDTIRKQLQQEEAQAQSEEELSGFDFMLRNNKILSNSISGLAETYFRNAALEEEDSMYY